MKKNLRILSALGLLTACGVATAADETPVVSTAPSLSSVLASSGITATGYVSTSYYHLSTDAGALHQFDTDHATFGLDQAALTLAFQPKEGFGALVNVIAGNDAKAINASEEGTGGATANVNTFNVTQAYLQYVSGGFTVVAGKLLTMAGAEVIAPTGNTNYSRSLLFTNLEPLTHTGIRATLAPSDVVSFTLGVNNGWNNTIDGNTQKTLEANVTVVPIPALSIGLTGYFGNDSDGSTGSTTLIDLVATWKVSDALSFALNYDNKSIKDFSTAGTAKASGVALYGNWAINEAWRLSLRVEQLKDDVADDKIKEATLTVGYMPTKSAEIRLELRKDKADDTLFADFGSHTPTDSQTEIAIQGLYKF